MTFTTDVVTQVLEQLQERGWRSAFGRPETRPCTRQGSFVSRRGVTRPGAPCAARPGGRRRSLRYSGRFGSGEGRTRVAVGTAAGPGRGPGFAAGAAGPLS